MQQLVLLISYLSLIQAKLIVIRQSGGDKVVGKQNTCRRSETFYGADLHNPCITSQEDIDCQLTIARSHNKHKIPTLISPKAERTLIVQLPYHQCADHYTVLKVQYWNYRNGRAFWSTRVVHQLTDTMDGKLKTGHSPVQATIRFKKHFDGLLLKLTFGCINPYTDASIYDDNDCLLVKFNGEISYPITAAYFNSQLMQRTTAQFPRELETTMKTDTVITTKSATLTTLTETDNIPSSHQSRFSSTTPIVDSNATQTTKSENSRGLHRHETTATYFPIVIKGKHFRVKKAIAISVVAILALIILNVLLCTFCRKRTKKEESEIYDKKFDPPRLRKIGPIMKNVLFETNLEPLLEESEEKPEKPVHEAFNPVYDIAKTPAHLSPYFPDKLKTQDEPTYARVNKNRGSS